MTAKEIIVFCLRYTAEQVVKDLDRNGVAPAPPKIAELLQRIGQVLSRLVPDRKYGPYRNSVPPVTWEPS